VQQGMPDFGGYGNVSRRRVLGGSILASGMIAGADILEAQPAAAVTAVVPLQYYDVRNNGAAGDGTTDDTAAFRKTINRASAAGGRDSPGSGRDLAHHRIAHAA
jgi:hypothetical protein